MNNETVNRKYKDTVFRLLFKDKSNLLSLFNAVNDTDFSDENDVDPRVGAGVDEEVAVEKELRRDHEAVFLVAEHTWDGYPQLTVVSVVDYKLGRAAVAF